MLSLFRISGMVLAAPVLNHRALPTLVKVGFALLLAILLLPTLSSTSLSSDYSLIDLLALGTKEALVGVIIGFFMRMVFFAAQMAGSLVGLQSGLSVANIIDPLSSQEVNVIGEFWLLVAGVIFLAIDGHHAVISAVANSFHVVPIGAVSFDGVIGSSLMKVSGMMFSMALKFAAPVMMTVFLVDVSMGILARTVPQMNIFVIGIPVKIAVSLTMVAVSLPLFTWALTNMVGYLERKLDPLVGSLATG